MLLFEVGEQDTEGKAWAWGQEDVFHDPAPH